jgi:hypothetical protein
MARTYTIRGKAPAAQTHTKIQLSSYDPKMQYKIVEFRIAPAGNPTQFNGYGILTVNAQDGLDPKDWNFAAQNQIAWAHNTVRQPVPPGIGESISMYEQNFSDYDRWFNYDIWLHTEDQTGNEEVNYYIKIYKQDTSAAAGAISSLSQYLAQGAL